MSSGRTPNSQTDEMLLPILATQLVGQLHRLLRNLAINLEKKRGQPPKTSLAAAKYLVTNGLVEGLTEEAVAESIDELEIWLTDGGWRGDGGWPPLLLTVEKAAAVHQPHGDIPTVTELIASFRTLVAWAESFLAQRPEDQADRDELVLLTVARLNLLSQPRRLSRPVTSETIVRRPTDRLEENWGDAVGVRTLSKGHFGNDQDAFTDACRALVVDLLDRAMARGRPKTIYLSTAVFDQSADRLRAEFDQKVVDCLTNGWRVVHVLDRVSGSDARVQVDFATNLLAHMQTRGVYVPIRDVPDSTTDMVLVEGVGAVIFPSIGFGTGPRPNPALVVRCVTGRGGTGDGPTATPVVAELRSEARAVFSHLDDVDPYLDKRELRFGYRVPTENLLWFDRQLSASELLEGDRVALKAELPTSTLSDELSQSQFEQWRRQLVQLAAGDPDLEGLVRGWSEARIAEAVEHVHRAGSEAIELALRRLQNKRSVRHFGFDTNTIGHRYRDCVLRSHLLRYLTEEDPWHWSNPAYGPAGLTLDERHQHVLSLCQRLEITRLNVEEFGVPVGYTLGLLEPERQPYDVGKTWWLATQSEDRRADQVHYLHQPSRSDVAYVATLKENSLARFDAVQTFLSLFDGVWYTIEVQDRFPTNVIDFLLDHLPKPVRAGFRRQGPVGLPR